MGDVGRRCYTRGTPEAILSPVPQFSLRTRRAKALLFFEETSTHSKKAFNRRGRRVTTRERRGEGEFSDSSSGNRLDPRRGLSFPSTLVNQARGVLRCVGLCDVRFPRAEGAGLRHL